MSRFYNFNPENKLRIPLSSYAAHIIESDCLSFSMKKTTLLNAIITNYYQQAPCSISLRLKEFRHTISENLSKIELSKGSSIIDKIVDGKKIELINTYARRKNADVNWQITLNKKVKQLLTDDATSEEELYYGEKPGHFVRSLIEEYSLLPFFKREEIIFQPIIDDLKSAIYNKNMVKITSINGNCIPLRPYSIATDPLSMFHYVIGYTLASNNSNLPTDAGKSNILSLRISRIIETDVQLYNKSTISIAEETQLLNELTKKGVQFMSGEISNIQVWLSDYGIKKYYSQLHLRPTGHPDSDDEHLFHFECTEAQILFYFINFGADAKVLSPASLVDKFKQLYENALSNYRNE